MAITQLITGGAIATPSNPELAPLVRGYYEGVAANAERIGEAGLARGVMYLARGGWKSSEIAPYYDEPYFARVRDVAQFIVSDDSRKYLIGESAIQESPEEEAIHVRLERFYNLFGGSAEGAVRHIEPGHTIFFGQLFTTTIPTEVPGVVLLRTEERRSNKGASHNIKGTNRSEPKPPEYLVGVYAVRTGPVSTT